jgi:uncharacterized protein YbjT (DUF2867 family)
MTRQTLEETTLVLGGTSKTGRRVVERLRARGLPVRVGSRSGEPPFDWDDRSTWPTALEGVGSVYISHYVVDGVQRALGREPKDFADFARDAAAAGAWKVRAPATEVSSS